MQGLSVEGGATTFEVDNPHVTVEWLYTRTTDLSKISIFRGKLPKEGSLEARGYQSRIEIKVI
jgi:hypothetical protein